MASMALGSGRTRRGERLRILMGAGQAAGAAAVIGDGDDGGEIGDGTFGAGALVNAADDKLLEAAKKRREACAASKSDDAEAARESFRFGGAFFHADNRDRRTGFT